MNEDSTLLRRYVESHDESAFAKIVDRHLSIVYGAAIRQLDGATHRAEEVTQSVFTDLARKAATLASRTDIVGWLYTSTHFAAAKLKRSEQRRQQREQEASLMHELSTAGAADAEWMRLRPVLDEAMNELSEPDRQVILQRFFQGRRFAEIAAQFGVTEDATRMRLDRALEKLRRFLIKREITSTTAALMVALANQPAIAVPAGLASAVSGAALASASTAAGPLAALFHLMNTSKTVAVIAGVAALLAISVAVYESNQAHTTAMALASVEQERANLTKRVASLETRVQEYSNQPAGAGRSAVSGKVATANNPPDPKDPASTAWAPISPAARVFSNLENRSLFLQQAALRVKQHYNHFFQTAGLSGEQQDEFLKASMDSIETRLDLAKIKYDHGFDPSATLEQMMTDPDVAAQFDKYRAAATRNDEAVKSLLGPAAYSQLKEYNRTSEERSVADRLAGYLYDTDAPLTREQADGLVTVLSKNRYAYQSPTSPTNKMAGQLITVAAVNGGIEQANLQAPWSTWSAPVTDAAIGGAETVLSPTQLARLKLLQTEQVTQLLFVPRSTRTDSINGGAIAAPRY